MMSKTDLLSPFLNSVLGLAHGSSVTLLIVSPVNTLLCFSVSSSFSVALS